MAGNTDRGLDPGELREVLLGPSCRTRPSSESLRASALDSTWVCSTCLRVDRFFPHDLLLEERSVTIAPAPASSSCLTTSSLWTEGSPGIRDSRARVPGSGEGPSSPLSSVAFAAVRLRQVAGRDGPATAWCRSAWGRFGRSVAARASGSGSRCT